MSCIDTSERESKAMNKVSISSLAWTILSTACISLDDVPLRPADGSDGGTDAAHDVALLSDGGMDDALVADAELDSQADSVGSRDAGTTLDGGTPVCNADGFCLVARFRPLSSIESDGHDVYLLDGPSTDMLGNRATDTRLWKVQSASTSVLADRIAVTDFQQLSGVSDGFVYWTQNGATYRVSSSGGLPQQVSPAPAFASGGVLWGTRDEALELRSADDLELLSSSELGYTIQTGAACGDIFYHSESGSLGDAILMRSRSAPDVVVELGTNAMFNTMLCDAGHVYIPHVQLGREGYVTQIDAQTKAHATVALGFKHTLQGQSWYSLRQYDPSAPGLAPTEGLMSVERWSTETPGDSVELGYVDDAQDIAATTTAVYVLDSAGSLFRKGVTPALPHN